ncbi:Oidioi.mRNA.OKI2018_I69.chr2.g6886.t1.cds [Oikopleura dioica]|uniref:Oidioi.mRNA.OKI2018_I69.chr2.g6886.t1.cds n=1 Tax=Oikopleura dioica TaxID=34765 RepID=A0ABN7T5E8_OIKDI|nr:Oidioi.mRNA.OKI2018_I69.chr2.g6886.t1.cds [Oikopleura dioica]
MDFGNRWKALEELERSQIEQVKFESAERKQRLEQEMRVGIGEEQERLIRREMEQQQARLRQMEESRRQRQEQLRARHEQEIEQSKRQRLSLNENHEQLKNLVEGAGMRAPETYRPPPTYRKPEQMEMDGVGEIMTSAPRTKASIMTPEAKTISGHLLYKEAVEVEDLVAEEDREAASLVAKTLTLSRSQKVLLQ